MKNTKPALDLETLFQSMQEGVVVQDSSGKVIQFNQAALKILEVSEDQLLGVSAMDPSWRAIYENGTDLVPGQHPSTIARVSGIPQKNKVLGVIGPSGKLRWLLVTAIPLFEKNIGAVHQVLVTFQDISEQIRAKELVQEKEEELSRILNCVPALIGHWDRDLKNIHANQMYSEYFGKTPEEIKGKHIRELLGDALFEKNYPFLKAALNGEVQTFERDLVLSSGEVRHTLAHYVPEIKFNEVVGIFVIVTDISELKNLEVKRRNLEAKLTSTATLCALGEMASGVAHEINNPLAVIQGKTELLHRALKGHGVNAEWFENDLVKIDQMVARIAKIIEGLRVFSGDGYGTPMTVSSSEEIIRQVLDLCSERFNKLGIKLDVSVAKTIDLECRPEPVARVLLDLLNNARDAITRLPEKWVRLEVDASDDFVSFSVTDSGRGISKNIVANMMNPFFTTKEIGKGTGLSLSVSKGIAESHRGSLEYDASSENTKFILKLPIRQT